MERLEIWRDNNPIGWSSKSRHDASPWSTMTLALFCFCSGWFVSRFRLGHVNQFEREARRRSTKSGTRHARLRVSIIKHNASGGILFGPTPRRSAIQGFSGYVRAIVKQRPSRRKRASWNVYTASSSSPRARGLGHKILWRNNSARTRFRRPDRENSSTCRSVTRKKSHDRKPFVVIDTIIDIFTIYGLSTSRITLHS